MSKNGKNQTPQRSEKARQGHCFRQGRPSEGQQGPPDVRQARQAPATTGPARTDRPCRSEEDSALARAGVAFTGRMTHKRGFSHA